MPSLPPLHLAAARSRLPSIQRACLEAWLLSRRVCRGGGVTSDHTPNGEAHGEADQGHEHPEDRQEVPVLTHAEQLLLQPVQATWGRGSGSEPSAEEGREGRCCVGLGSGGPVLGAWEGLCLTCGTAGFVTSGGGKNAGL